MTGTLQAGAARRVVNPPLGTRQTGFRLFGNPVQAVESDLTATALVLADGATKVVVIGIDLSIVGIDLSLRGQRPAQPMRVAVAEALDVPVAHVLLNTSHTHAGVALPDYMPDTPEQMRLKERYRDFLAAALVAVAVEADARLQPARIGCGWGESTIGVYRQRDPRRPRRPRRGAGSPDRPVRRRHPHRRPRRRPARDRLPLLVPPGHDGASLRGRLVRLPGGCPGGGRAEPRRARAVPPGRRGQHQPASGDGARDRLPRHEEPRRRRARRGGRQGGRPHPHEHAGRGAAAARERPRHPVHAVGAGRGTGHSAHRGRRGGRRARLRRPSFARRGARDPGRMAADARPATRRRRPRTGRCGSRRSTRTGPGCSSRPRTGAPRRATSFCRPCGSATSSSPAWTPRCSSRAGSRSAPARLFPTRSCSAARTGRSGISPARRITRRQGGTSAPRYAVPDLIFQVHPHPVALHPGSERRAVEATLALIDSLSD